MILYICGKGTKSRVIPPLLVLVLLYVFLIFAGPQSPVAAQAPAPLTAPTDLSASVSAEGITLSWTAPAGPVDGYEILRRFPLQGKSEMTTLVDNTGSSETSYTDASAKVPGERYIYRVKTIRGQDRSAISPFVRVDLAGTVITVDSDCSLANAIRSANGETQIAEDGDSDGNDDCEAGTEPDDTAVPPETGEDLIQLTGNITLSAVLPAITTQVQIDGNSRSVSGADSYPVFEIDGVAVSISDITITNGLTTTYGGGIYVDGGSLSLSNGKVKNNTAGDIGGGIYASDSNVDIIDGEFSGNSTSQSHGGGMYFVSSDGSHTLSIGGETGSTFKKNTSAEDGGGLKVAGGIVSITKSTFSENTSDEGGAIESSGATVAINNSTFSNNSAREGGGLSSFGSDVTLTHTTWAYNTAAEQGGGIAIIGWSGSFKIRNTLITDSVSGGDCHPGPNPDIIIEFTGNFIQDGSCTPTPEEPESQTAVEGEGEAAAQATEVEDGELQAQHAVGEDDEAGPVSLGDPQIMRLAGSPAHHPLQWGSPAIDGGDPEYCLDDDQPGTSRPQYDNCDIGAYEYPKPPEPTPEPPRDDDDDDDDDPDPPATPEPQPSPTPEDPPNVCIPTERILVQTANDDLQCEPVDIITLDKHPALQGGRFAVRLWRSNRQCLHRVVAGDNLYRLAIQYQTAAETLRSLNGIVGNQLSVGQNLLLPSCVLDDSLAFENTRICFENQGNLVFIDTSVSPPTAYSLEKFSLDVQTCATVTQSGIVVLTALGS